jgi:hypothetical protein
LIIEEKNSNYNVLNCLNKLLLYQQKEEENKENNFLKLNNLIKEKEEIFNDLQLKTKKLEKMQHEIYVLKENCKLNEKTLKEEIQKQKKDKENLYQMLRQSKNKNQQIILNKNQIEQELFLIKEKMNKIINDKSSISNKTKIKILNYISLNQNEEFEEEENKEINECIKLRSMIKEMFIELKKLQYLIYNELNLECNDDEFDIEKFNLPIDLIQKEILNYFDNRILDIKKQIDTLENLDECSIFSNLNLLKSEKNNNIIINLENKFNNLQQIIRKYEKINSVKDFIKNEFEIDESKINQNEDDSIIIDYNN